MAQYDMFQNMYTPEEVARMKAQLEQSYQNAAVQNQNLNTAASMTKNLSPMANLGILLGTLAGKWGAQRLNDIYDKEIYNQKKANNENTNWQNVRENGLYSGLMNLPDYQFNPYSPYARNPFNPQTNPQVQNPVPSTALNPPSTFFSNNTPDWDWRNQNYLTHQTTRPSYLSIR